MDAVSDGDTAHYLMNDKEYDLLILDWMLPRVSGIDLCKLYRHSGKGVPVLVLTARDTTADKVAGLDAGADDYAVKPVDVIELLARVRALGRRSPLWIGDRLTLGNLVLDLSTMTAYWGEAKAVLTVREFQFLEYFLRHPNQVCTRDQLELNLWEWDKQPESNAVSSQVRRLRQRLKSLGIEDWIETIYGVGYRMRIPETQSR
ncbi:response regulator transcription factor [Leptolyngbya sp. O-77]|uniref:response regulator transcription factor n=1 Tax=Leptolyngbya sp. O-77 TaxID=1080068 RepID=UPI00074D442A|nr:response regulator transcription factor [Leptolyngbya sp. O-77]BAU42798.1 Transcriptional regulatory protein CusR [Leptolyngbya sp. O-77]